jgi:hypothetical protein
VLEQSTIYKPRLGSFSRQQQVKQRVSLTF